MHTEVNSVPVSQPSGSSDLGSTRNYIVSACYHASKVDEHMKMEDQISTTYIRHNVLEPRIFFSQLLKPLPRSGACIFLSSIYPCVLIMDTCFWYFTTDSIELTPGSFLKPLQIRAWLADGEVVCSCPR